MVLLRKLTNNFYLIACVISIICTNYLLCQSDDNSLPFVTNEKLNYKLYYNGIKAGSATMKINKKNIGGKNFIELNSEIKTNSFVDLFYKIRDDITVYMNYNDFSLLKVTNKIHEGLYKKNHTAIFDINSNNIVTAKKKIKIDKAYSPLSIIYSLRNELLNINDIYKYHIYNLGKIKKIDMKVVDQEMIKTSFGKFNAIVVSPVSNNDSSIIRNNGDMKIWFTNDENRYPIKIELKINYGRLVLLLNDIE